MTIHIALAKGRLVDEMIDLLKKIDIHFPDFTPESRKLIFTTEKEDVRIILVKASDVPTYVEKGAADFGVVGKDTLQECAVDVYDMVDLNFGKCKFVVAGLDSQVLQKKKLIVASKYPQVAREYFAETARPIDIIKLNGSVELAPLIGLADCIVDIVETGNTLKENGVKILEEISDISSRLIVNRASYKTNYQKMHGFITKLQNAVSNGPAFASSL